METDSLGTTTAKYTYGPGIDEPITMEKGGETYYYHFDGLGSVTALTDSTGTTAETYQYDVFGEPSTASAVGNPYMFTGRRYDDETGLYYFRARMYAPLLGRFLQTDPIGYATGINLYTYCDNNPSNWVDPKGDEPITATAFLVTSAVVAAGYVIVATDWQKVGISLSNFASQVQSKVINYFSRTKLTPSGQWPPSMKDLGIIEPGIPGTPPKIPFKKIPKWMWPLPFIKPLKDIIEPVIEQQEEPREQQPDLKEKQDPKKAKDNWERIRSLLAYV